MLSVAAGFTIIFLIAGAGYALRRTNFLDAAAVPIIHKLTFFILTPSLFFTALATADIHVLFSTYFPVVASVSVLGLLVAGLVARFVFREKFATATATATSASYMNANFVGIPLATYVLGDSTLSTPVMLFQLLVVTPVLLAIFDHATSGRITVASVLIQPVRNPIVVASLAGVIVSLTGFEMPFVVAEPLRLLGTASVPLALLMLGMTFHGDSLLQRERRGQVVMATVVKLVVMPFAGWILAAFVFHLDPWSTYVVVLLMALPTGLNAQNYTMRYGLSDAVARETIAVTTILAMPVMMLCAALLLPTAMP